MVRKKNVYAINVGRKLGYRTRWDDVLKETNGYSEAEFKGFSSLKEAEKWFNDPSRSSRRARHLARPKELEPHERRQLEADVKALNDNLALEIAAEVVINEMEIYDTSMEATSTPSSSPSSSSHCSCCYCSSFPGDTLPSSPPSTKPVKTTSSPASD
ncbi:ribonuclease H1 [Fusarium bulbicola]|nr:ribonuclease H1 [Fusarium bulbicola]